MTKKSGSYVRDSETLEASETSPVFCPLPHHSSNTKGPAAVSVFKVGRNLARDFVETHTVPTAHAGNSACWMQASIKLGLNSA